MQGAYSIGFRRRLVRDADDTHPNTLLYQSFPRRRVNLIFSSRLLVIFWKNFRNIPQDGNYASNGRLNLIETRFRGTPVTGFLCSESAI